MCLLPRNIDGSNGLLRIDVKSTKLSNDNNHFIYDRVKWSGVVVNLSLILDSQLKNVY